MAHFELFAVLTTMLGLHRSREIMQQEPRTLTAAGVSMMKSPMVLSHRLLICSRGPGRT